MLADVDACSPEFTGESYMFNKQTNSTCSPQFRGELYMFNFLKWHVQPGRVELHMSFFYDRLSQRVKRFRTSLVRLSWIHVLLPSHAFATCHGLTLTLAISSICFVFVSEPAMTLIDSTAAFEKRCDELRAGLKDIFSASFVTTFSELAFAVGTPQSPVTDAVMQRFADNLFGGPCTIGDCAVIKRLHFEAITLVMADLRLQVTSGDMSEPLKKLPYVEKIRRINQQQNRITGISHKNEQQPSHSLIDTCFQMVESGALIYIAPSKCSSRDSEIAAESKAKTKQVLTLEQGALKTSSAPELPPADVGTELKLMFALQRRGLAFDLVNLVSWSVHVEWTNKLYRALMTEAASGFHPITLSQLLKADRELFMILASEETGPLKADPGNDPPLDAAIGRLMLDPRVNIHLTPMPKFDKRPAGDIQRDRDDKPKQAQER